VIFNYRIERDLYGKGDIQFLENAFHKLLFNFNWWVNRKDRTGSNVFEGGFLGLDNIGLFDRSAPLPGGVYLEQADGTAWMALFCQNMLEIAIELALHNPIYEEMVIKFFEHFLMPCLDSMGESMTLWDEEFGSTMICCVADEFSACQGPLYGGDCCPLRLLHFPPDTLQSCRF
jgi:hypothetical protein